MLYRTFTKREKVLFIIFGLILVGAVYYLVVWKPYTEEMDRVQGAIYSAQSELDLVTARFNEMISMENKLKTLPTEAELKPLPPFDNVNSIMQFLNATLAPSDNFNVSFSGVNAEEDFVRRNINISFACEDAAVARRIVDQLFDAPYRSQVNGYNFTNQADGGINATVSIVFFELK